MKSKTRQVLTAACAAVMLAGPASAHVVLEYQVASAGSSYKATFKVTHGCGPSPTRQIVVQIPSGVRGARPMPKPGWSLDIQRAPLAQPYTNHGRTVSEDVVRITWTAKAPDDMLPNAQYDEFVLVGQLPGKPGTMYWPVNQLCAQGRNDWVQVPGPNQKLSDLEAPAALLEVLPGGGDGGHQH